MIVWQLKQPSINDQDTSTKSIIWQIKQWRVACCCQGLLSVNWPPQADLWKGLKDRKWARDCILQCEALGTELAITVEYGTYQGWILHGTSSFVLTSMAGEQERSKWQNLKKIRRWKWRFKLLAFKVSACVNCGACWKRSISELCGEFTAS